MGGLAGWVDGWACGVGGWVGGWAWMRGGWAWMRMYAPAFLLPAPGCPQQCGSERHIVALYDGASPAPSAAKAACTPTTILPPASLINAQDGKSKQRGAEGSLGEPASPLPGAGGGGAVSGAGADRHGGAGLSRLAAAGALHRTALNRTLLHHDSLMPGGVPLAAAWLCFLYHLCVP